MKTLRVLVLALLAAIASGCAVTLPLQMSINESYLTHPDAYSVLGQAEGTSSMSAILFFPMSGDAGYRAAVQDALTKASADGLINCVCDITYSNMFLVRTIKTTVRGLAIKKK